MPSKYHKPHIGTVVNNPTSYKKIDNLPEIFNTKSIAAYVAPSISR